MKALATSLLLVAMLLVPQSIGAAQDGEILGGGSESSDARISAGPSGDGVEVVGTQAFGDVLSGGGLGLPEWMLACTWDVRTRADLDALYAGSGVPVGVTPVGGGADPEEQWAVVFCPASPEARAANPGVVFTGILEAWPVGGPPPQVVLDWLIARAYASVEVPVQVGRAAPAGDEEAPFIAQLPTWLWVDPLVWVPRSATTPPVFGVTATVTATPVNVAFEGADGERVDCGANTGPSYDFDLDEDEQSSDCTLTYRHSSSIGDWTLSSTITWEVTYACSAFCGSGVLPDIVVTSTRDVRVAELQAVAIG